MLFISCATTPSKNRESIQGNSPQYSDNKTNVTAVTTSIPAHPSPHENQKELVIEKDISESFSAYHSSEFGYSLSNTSSDIFTWTNVQEFAPEVDHALINGTEDFSLYAVAHHFSGINLRPKVLMQTQLAILGFDNNTTTVTILNATIPNAKKAYSFKAKKVIEGIDFEYRGIFTWDGSRLIMVYGWSQGILFEKISPTLSDILKSLTLSDTYDYSPLPKHRTNSSNFLSAIGIEYLKKEQPLIALGYFEKANKVNPTDTLHLLNCAYVYQEKQFFSPGIHHFEEQIETVKKSSKLLSVLAEMYESTKQYEKARHYNTLALQLNPVDNEATINLSDALWAQGQKKQSLKVVQKLYDTKPSLRVGLYLSQTYMGLEQYSTAIDLLFSIKENFGITEQLAEYLVTSLIVQKRFEEALSVTQELEAVKGPSFSSWLFKGKCQYFLKRFRHAQHSLKKAIKLDKEHDEAHSFLAATNGFLGESNLSAIKKNIPFVGTQPKLKNIMQSKSHISKEAHAFVHYKSNTLKFKKETKWRITERLVVEILDSTGINMFSEMIYPFEPGYDYLHINSLAVYKSNKKLRYKAPVKDFYISNEMDNNAATGSQLAHLPLKQLSIGDIIYLTITRSSVEKSYEIPFFDHQSSLTVPVALDLFTVIADTTHTVFEEYGDNTRTTQSNKTTWTTHNPVIIKKERFMPHYIEYGTGVRVSSKHTWQDIGIAYESSIEHQFKSSLGIKEKAIDIQNNSRDTQKVIDDIIQWVRQYVEYKNLPFGGHATVPNRSILTLNQGYGDCKDQSLLVKEMLESIGVPSYLVLVNQDAPTSVALPTIQQFNHMILYIPKGENWREQYIDITDNIGSHRIVPIELEGKNVLIIEGAKSRLSTTPIIENPNEHSVDMYHTIVTHKNGSADFRDSIVIKGKFASQMREVLYEMSEAHQKNQINEWLKTDIPTIQITQLTIENIRDYSKPIIIKLIFSAKSLWKTTDDIISGELPSFWERSFLRLPKIKERHHPIKLPHQARFSSTTKIIVPDGFEYNAPSRSAPHSLKYVSLQSTTDSDPNVITNRWTTYPLYADASEYNNIKKEWQYILDAASQPVTFTND